MIHEIESFSGWSIQVVDGWLHIKKDRKGTMIRLPNKSAKLTDKLQESKTIRLRDHASVWGDESAGETHLRDTLKLIFDVDGKPYHFIFLSDDDGDLVIYGWTHWDGDIFGFHIARLG